MSGFFRKKFHKITLLITAVFWANCGAAEEKQDTTGVLNDSSKLETSDSTKKEKILEVSDWLDHAQEFYYGVSADNYELGDPWDGLEYAARELIQILDDKQRLKK
jgi:hypothetical protein